MNALLDFKRGLFFMADELSDIKRELIFRRLLRLTIKAGYKDDQDRDELGRWTSEGGVTVETSDGFLTGIPSIDETSQALSDTLVSVMETLEYLPTMSASQYGIAVHAAFGAAVSLQDLPGVGDIERSFSLDAVDPTYGMAGTIRTDLTLRDIQGDVIAIYDVKTGNARMSSARADELREMTRSSPNTPVFELNVVRGVSRKSRGAMSRCTIRIVSFCSN
ncbi:hypothetical protein LPB73_16815 [Tardiphaga sp. 37S4]|jgi:hypothetical protein|uniref:hypothetical protein n=1 Tax=Tardiphaga sp. 37S4 TaxID=1404741 RepID=UPI001E415282|nr:hypothetical protein [Tardiphaga sp. 37S4]UFS73602.1 hypothetical protein LPB73_16815 [Tardiphaga sp. 37S4]